MKAVQAIFDHGVFRPTEPVDLPEGSQVEFEPRVISERTAEGHRARIHALLSRSIESGEYDMAQADYRLSGK